MKHSIFRHTIAVFCFAIVLGSVAAAAVGYLYNSRNISERANYYALSGAATAISVIDSLDYEALCKSDKSDLYVNTRDEFKSICDAFKLEYLYVYEVLQDSNSIRYIMCVSSDAEKDKTVSRERGLGTVVSHVPTEQEKMAIEGKAYDAPYLTKNQFGEVYTWVSPLEVDVGAKVLVGSEYRTEDLKQETIHAEIVTILPMTAVIILIFLFVLLAMRKRIFIPIKRLSEHMNGFMAQKGVDSESLNIRTDDEIGEMANSFMRMSDDIRNYLQNIESLTAERARANVELEVARRIQNGIVPVEKELKGDTYDLYAYARPAKKVGGDFYDCFKTSAGKLCVVIGDVSDKGIAAAMFMTMTKTMLHDRLNEGKSPADVLNKVNASLCSSNPEGMFVTVFAAVLDPETGEVCYANAGHTRPVIFGENTRMLDIDSGMAIGLFDDSDIADEHLILKKGEGILLYTDGVTDSVSPERNFFGEKRLLDSVSRVSGAKNAITALGKSVSDFVSDAEQFDDYTVLAIYNSGGGKTVLTLKPVETSLPELREAVLNVTGNTPGGKKIYLACDEAFANITEYSGAERVDIEIEKCDAAVTVIFKDDGIPFDPTTHEESKEFEELDGGGMGIGFIRNISDKMSYIREDNKNILTLTFTLKEKK